MSEEQPEFVASDNYPQLDAKDTDRKLSQYYSNSFRKVHRLRAACKRWLCHPKNLSGWKSRPHGCDEDTASTSGSE